MFDPALKLTRPGLFITATDTGVGKTVAACAIAAALRGADPPHRAGVCKPFVSGCQRRREGLVGEDTEALAHFADSRQPLDVISPIRFAAPLAPAVAADEAGQTIDLDAVRRALVCIEADSDIMLVEGVGGLLVPLAPRMTPSRSSSHERGGRARGEQSADAGASPAAWWTVLDLAAALDYPVVIVARVGLGTLNHTAMTARLLRETGCRIAGIVINGYEADAARGADPSIAGNRVWLPRLTNVPVAAVLPRCPDADVQPHKGRLALDVLDAAAACDWASLARPPRSR